MVIVSNRVGQATSLPSVTLTVSPRPATGNDYFGRLPQGGDTAWWLLLDPDGLKACEDQLCVWYQIKTMHRPTAKQSWSLLIFQCSGMRPILCWHLP
jgi:hypothetical protein